MEEDKQQRLSKAFKRKWINALRSGKYIQGDAALKKTTTGDDDFESEKKVTKYCCLGVACVVSGAKIIGSSGYIDGFRSVRGMRKVPKLLHGSSGIPEKLADLNDQGNSFEEIALWIEKNL